MIRTLALLLLGLGSCVHPMPSCTAVNTVRCLGTQVQRCSSEHHWMTVMDCGGDSTMPMTCQQTSATACGCAPVFGGKP